VRGLEERIAYVRGTSDFPDAQQILKDLEQALQAEWVRVTEWYRAVALPVGVPSGGQNLFPPDQMAAFKRAWDDVFRFYPEYLARFAEVETLNQRESALFDLMRREPALIPDWREAKDALNARWTPFYTDAQAKLSLVSKERLVICSLAGHVNDGDWPDGDDKYDFNEPVRFTTRMNIPTAIIRSYAADEVKLNVNVTAKLIAGAGDQILLTVNGSGEVWDDDDSAGSFQIGEQLTNGQESVLYRAGDDDDYGEIRFRFDLAPSLTPS
jgi:hypothetical protein